ncbi:hypothetical protein PNQ29_11215 [Halobacterium salinarum]|uniref:hypothetical protein n=1 Tax=Halobacterium salinarum TaxID=2242 RepID=UPI00255298C5|nr:hypothetical protein [Halobacterium salinarum]MDL0120288.1 hypothetical protein [Halobacterium salinarum]MDL0134333.1 hypothetical protein [Halobacterium salinarum]
MTTQLTTPTHIYHVSAIDNLDSILEHGIQPQSTHRDTLEDDLSTVAAAHGIELPIDRSKCVFCYPTLSGATELMSITDEDRSPLSPREAIVVIDGAQIHKQLYVGEFDLISDAIDLQHMDEPDAAITAESYEDALRRYAASLTPFHSFETLGDSLTEYQTPEVVIQDGVDPNHILEWRLLKQIQEGTDSCA